MSSSHGSESRRTKGTQEDAEDRRHRGGAAAGEGRDGDERGSTTGRDRESGSKREHHHHHHHHTSSSRRDRSRSRDRARDDDKGRARSRSRSPRRAPRADKDEDKDEKRSSSHRTSRDDHRSSSHRHRHRRSRSRSRSDSGSDSDSESDHSHRHRSSQHRSSRHRSSRHHDETESEREERRRRKKEKKRDKKDKKDRKKKGLATIEWGKHGILTETDIYQKDQEFRAWLIGERMINPETISKAKEKEIFKDFMEDFNTGTLAHEKYYDMDKYEKKMNAIRGGETIVSNDRYDPNADLESIRNSHKRAPVQTETFLDKSKLEALARVQRERVEAERMKLLGMKVGENFGKITQSREEAKRGGK